MTALAVSTDGNAGAEGAARDRTLPAYVRREFADYLTCGRLEHGSLRHIPVPHPPLFRGPSPSPDPAARNSLRFHAVKALYDPNRSR